MRRISDAKAPWSFISIYQCNIQANEQENDEDDYLVDHSIVLYLISPDGEFLDFFTQRMTVKDVVGKIDKYMKDPKYAKSLEK